MKIVVKDANIIFSLLDADLMDIVMELQHEIWTTDFVLSEIENGLQLKKIEDYISEGRIKLYSFNSAELEKITLLSANRSLSVTDCSVFLASEIKSAALITGDKTLRNFAESNGVEVRGLLWIFDELIKYRIIEPDCAIQKLIFISQSSMRLPTNEVESRRIKWSSLN